MRPPSMISRCQRLPLCPTLETGVHETYRPMASNQRAMPSTRGEGHGMRCRKRILAGAMLALLPLLASTAANAQKQGGTLRIFHRDSPANMSIHEEGTISVVAPMMPIFNNLVLFNQHEKQNRLDDIVPDLADSWSWSEDGKDLTFKLHQGVKWHDGKPFTAADVKCTWDLLQNKATEKLRLNAREAWWANLDNVTADNDYQATFHLKRPQPAFIAFLASGFTPVYPCHVSPAQMRQHPIGTGPFKFVEYKPSQSIKVVKNPDYWKKGLPYLDAIEWTIIPNRSTQMLAFVAGQFDMTFPYEVTAANMKDIKSQMPNAICEIAPTNFAPNLLMNRKPPFDNPELRKAVAMTIDHQAFVDILGEGNGDVGTAVQPGPEGQWAMPKEMREQLPGYAPDVAKSREEARKIMQSLGYGPDKHLDVQDRRAQPAGLSRRRLAGDRPAEADLYRRRARTGRNRELAAAAGPLGFRPGAECGGRRHRRPGPDLLRELRLQIEPQLHALLRSRDREDDRPAVDGARSGEAQEARLGDRQQVAAGGGAADRVLPAQGDLLAARGQGAERHGQQLLQRLALRGCLARQIVRARPRGDRVTVKGQQPTECRSVQLRAASGRSYSRRNG